MLHVLSTLSVCVCVCVCVRACVCACVCVCVCVCVCAVLSKRLSEQKMEFEAYRDKLIANYQEGKLAQEKVSAVQRCSPGAQLYTICAMVCCTHGPFLMGPWTIPNGTGRDGSQNQKRDCAQHWPGVVLNGIGHGGS